MLGFIIRILGNSAAIYVAHRFVPGFGFTGGWKEFLMAGIILGLLNWAVKPVIKFISFPLIILTLGLFGLVINALLLWVVDYIFDFVAIQNITALVWATIVITVVNMIVSAFSKVID